MHPDRVGVVATVLQREMQQTLQLVLLLPDDIISGVKQVRQFLYAL